MRLCLDDHRQLSHYFAKVWKEAAPHARLKSIDELNNIWGQQTAQTFRPLGRLQIAQYVEELLIDGLRQDRRHS